MTTKNIQDVVAELDNLANVYGWHHNNCMGHSHHPSCPVVKLRRMILGLTQLVKEVEAGAYINGKKAFLKDIHKISYSHRGKRVAYIIHDEVGSIDWDKMETLTPPTGDEALQDNK